jgi:hypothetical protein
VVTGFSQSNMIDAVVAGRAAFAGIGCHRIACARRYCVTGYVS